MLPSEVDGSRYAPFLYFGCHALASLLDPCCHDAHHEDGDRRLRLVDAGALAHLSMLKGARCLGTVPAFRTVNTTVHSATPMTAVTHPLVLASGPQVREIANAVRQPPNGVPKGTLRWHGGRAWVRAHCACVSRKPALMRAMPVSVCAATARESLVGSAPTSSRFRFVLARVYITVSPTVSRHASLLLARHFTPDCQCTADASISGVVCCMLHAARHVPSLCA